MVLLFLIRKLQDLTSSCSKSLEILLLSDSYTRFSFPKRRTFENFGDSEALLTTVSNKRHCWILLLHHNFKNYQVKERNWFMQELVWSFFSLFGSYRALQVPTQIYLKYCFYQLATPNFLFQKDENLEN